MNATPDKPPSDELDLSGASAPKDPSIDEVLRDARARRLLRIWASGIAAAVVLWLLVLVTCAVRAMVADLTKVNTPVVSVLSVLVVALAALGIVAIKAIFADTGNSDSKTETTSLPAGALELAKAIVDAGKTIVGIGKPG